MTSCLLVIDAQESFRHRPYFSLRDFDAYVRAQNQLIEACLAAQVAVVRIFHTDGPEAADNPFSLASGMIRPLNDLTACEPVATFHKSRHSALVGTGLPVWLIENGIRTVIISGIRTEQCCETTTRHAADLGWAVDYVTDATLTFDMAQADGTLLCAADIKARTATVLADRFANICTVDQAIERLR